MNKSIKRQRSIRTALIAACNQLHPQTKYDYESCVTVGEMRGELLESGMSHEAVDALVPQ